MKKEHIDQVTAGFVSMITDELASDSGIRFQRAAKLCQQAHMVAQMSALRVTDVDGEGDGDYMVMMNDPIRRAGRINRERGGDAGDAMREMVHAIQPMLDNKAEQGEESRLSRLLTIRERLVASGRALQVDAVDARIDSLLANLSTDKETTHGATIDLDDPIVLRRPATGGDQSGQDEADHREGDGVGEEGAGEATGRSA